MTVEINGYEIHCANVLYVTPIHEELSPTYAKPEDAQMKWERFDIVFKGRENDMWFTSNYGSNVASGNNFKTKEELIAARNKLIEALNKSYMNLINQFQLWLRTILMDMLFMLKAGECLKTIVGR